MEKLRIGFAGTGFMGQVAHLINYSALGDICRVVALAEPRTDLARAVASRYGVPGVYATHSEMLDKADLDAVVCSQYYANHALLVPDILRAGKPVFTEKPIAVSPETGETLADLADELNVLYMVGYHKRSDPAMEAALSLIREWKESGSFGRMRYVRATMPPGDWIGGGGYAHLKTDEPYPAMQGEGLPPYFTPQIGQEYNAFVNYYIHQVNALRFFFGESYRVAYAEPSGTVMAVESASGIPGVLEMAPYETSLDWQESYLVSFDKAWIKVELPAPLAVTKPGKLTVYRDGPGVSGAPTLESPTMPNVHAMMNQARNFVAAVKGERSVPCTGREAVEDLRIAKDYIKMRFKA